MMVGIGDMETRKAAVRRVTWLGLAVNLLLSGFKMIAGWLGNSQAVLADGVHSLSDLSTDIAVLVGVQFWTAPADESHPHGHQRIETAVTAFIGIVLALVAVLLGYHALATLHEPHKGGPGALALVAAVVSIVCKEGIYRWTLRVGKRVRSTAVIANAWHHRSDAFSSIPATIAVLGAMLVPSWYFLDHIGAIVVSVFILQAAWQILHPALRELTDAGAPPEVLDFIETKARETTGVRGVHKIRTRRMGAGLQADLHIQVDAELTVKQGHEIAGIVRRRLVEEGPDIIDVIIHVEPWEGK